MCSIQWYTPYSSIHPTTYSYHAIYIPQDYISYILLYMDLGKHKIAKTKITQLFFAQTNYATWCIKISNSMPNTCYDSKTPLGFMVATNIYWGTPPNDKSQHYNYNHRTTTYIQLICCIAYFALFKMCSFAIRFEIFMKLRFFLCFAQIYVNHTKKHAYRHHSLI